MYDDAPDCPQCGGETFHLGRLGPLDHFRCRACGGQTSQAAVARCPDCGQSGETRGHMACPFPSDG